PGYCAEILYLYLATDLNKTLAHPDEDEFLDVLRLPFDSVLAKVLSGEIKDAKTCVAVLKTAQMFPKKD
ncbi:MAG: NUDIX hydrolase, partial [Oscillospiraceae bacterium]|nr:NUDIX hydrolase [Oscillospiraceae bacterium]